MRGVVKGGNNDGGGMKIVGQGEYIATYYEAIEKGDLVTTRRYFGFDTLIKQANPDVLPNNTSYAIAFSPDDKYVVIGYASTPYILIYKIANGVFTKLNTTISLSGTLYTASFSPNGKYLTVYDGTDINIYRVNNDDTFTKLTVSFTDLNMEHISWSRDNRYLAFASQNTLYIYSVDPSTDTFTQITSVAPGVVEGVSWSANGNYVALGQTGNQYMNIYKFDGTTLTKLTNPSTVPVNTTNGSFPTFHPTDETCFVAISTTRLIVYSLINDVINVVADISTVSTLTRVAWSSDGKYVAITTSGSPYVIVWKKEGNTYTKMANPDVIPTGIGRNLTYGNISPYLVVTHTTSPFVTIYKADILGDFAHKYTGLNDLYVPNYVNFGYATTAGLTNAINKKIVTLPIK